MCIRHIGAVLPAVLLLVVAGSPGEVRAGRAGARLEVSAHVPATLDYALLSKPADLALTEADLAAGFKDLDGAAVLSVRTNADAFLLELALPAAPWLASVEARVGGSVRRGVPGATLLVSVPGVSGDALTRVDLRLHLAPGALPGTYPLPVSLGLSPL